MKKTLVIGLILIVSVLAINLKPQTEKPVYYGPYLPAETLTVLNK